jgi:hypothetical protein
VGSFDAEGDLDQVKLEIPRHFLDRHGLVARLDDWLP